MIKRHTLTSEHSTSSRGTLQTYTTGFIVSIILTIGAYLLVTQSFIDLPYRFIVFAVIGLAVVQLAVQLQFFIHLGHESKPRWNKLIFIFMLLVLMIVVIGSLWIMSNLNYNVMDPEETKTYIQEEEGIQR